MKTLALLIAIFIGIQVQAAKVAIVDSGTDFTHELLKGREWVNPSEKPGNLIDDDNNKKVDDVNGWNFIEGYEKFFFREHLQNVHPITFDLFAIIARIQAGQATAEDKAFWEKHVTSLNEQQKQALFQHLNFYGQYAHGTHCSGVVALQNPKAQLMSARVFPDDPPSPYAHPKGIADFFYGLLARLTNGSFIQVAAYLNEQKIDVANYSLGVPLKALAQQFLALRGNQKPTDEELAQETQRLYRKYEPQGRKWMQSAPQTLFVVAAGNDGSDNDKYPTFPSNVRIENSISVAATQGIATLATFSNYGLTTVDVAAPGVAILSSVPSLDSRAMLAMSGTSMAAPYVTGVASKVKEINPALTPVQIKQILMETVDKKDWLEKKVISGGVVHPERAYIAAEKSKTMTLPEAISLSRKLVIDRVSEKSFIERPQSLSPELLDWSEKLVF